MMPSEATGTTEATPTTTVSDTTAVTTTAPVETAPAETAVPEPSTVEPANLPLQTTSNASEPLPPGAQAAAAKAHVLLTRIKVHVDAAVAEIEKFVPAGVISAAESEVEALLRSLL
jgi:hypothetical protein